MAYQAPSLPELIEFVEESNAIEGITEGWGHPLFDQHLNIAMRVAYAPRKILPTPLIIHKALLGGIEEHAGRYRNCAIFVGSKQMPHERYVGMLMDEWEQVSGQFCKWVDRSDAEKKKFAWSRHDSFLCIHPNEDGNGRTSRLLLNVYRRSLNLPWHTVCADERGFYYQKIEEYEDTIFKTRHPDVYV